jgi:methyl-accepting chemotaxis protein
MSEIEKSSTQISQIIGVIDEIAFQTNLLALNAGVEAARAGEAGKGFAVVASEVRALAQRSAEAAKEIKGLIQASTTHVSSGVELVGETGKALDRIAIQVTEINAIVAEIAASAQEQSTGLAEVNTAVNEMDQVTQQNAAMVEQSTAASHSLAQEADALATLIGRFDVGGACAPIAAKPRKPHAPAAKATKPARRTILQALTGRGSNLAVKQAAPAEESWEEF